MKRTFTSLAYFLIFASSHLKSEDSLSFLLSHLEYDQEIKGLYVPAGYFKGLQGSLFIGSARITPAAGKLYCLGWTPVLQLDSIAYRGSARDFFSVAKELAVKSRSDLHLNRLKTDDCMEEANYIVSRNGFVKAGL